MPMGGRRPGAGRKPGSKTKKMQELAAAIAAAGVSPLEYMLTVLRDPAVEPSRRDEMAKSAAPYIHPRLSAVEAKLELVGHEKALAELEGPMIVDAIAASEVVAANGHAASESEQSSAAVPQDAATALPAVPAHVFQ